MSEGGKCPTLVLAGPGSTDAAIEALGCHRIEYRSAREGGEREEGRPAGKPARELTELSN